MVQCSGNAPINISGRKFAPKNILLQWHITEQCDCACLHCYQVPGNIHHGMSFSSMCAVLEQFLCLIGEFDRINSPHKTRAHVTITGGEPFMHPEALDLIDLLSAHRNRLSFAILTNGTLVDDRLARFLAITRPRFVQVSLDGDSNTHDRMRGAGNFKAVCAGVRCLVRYDVPTMISFTANSFNYKDFPKVVQQGRKLGVNLVWADRFVPLGQSESSVNMVLSPSRTEEFVLMVSREAAASSSFFHRRFRVAAGRALQFIHADGTPYFCKAGRSLLTVMSNGDLVPCRRMPVITGNVRRESLKELYWNNETLQALRRRDITVAGCENCAHAGKCRGGLRCLSYALNGDWFTADPGCWIASGGRA